MFCFDKDRYNTKKILISVGLFLFVGYVVFFICGIIDDGTNPLYNKLQILGLSGWIVLFAFFIAFKYITNVCVTPATILVLSMFAFSYGQILLFGLGIEYNYFFYNSYYASFYGGDLRLLISANFYTLICLWFFCLGILTSVGIKNRNGNANNIKFSLFGKKNDAKFDLSMKKTFVALFFISAIPYLTYNVYLLFYSLSHGYSQSLELNQPAIIRYIGVFFVPSAIGTVISCGRNKKLKTVIVLCIAFNCVCSLFIGGRSLALGLIIGVIVILLMNKKISGVVVFALCVGAFLLATLSVSVADYRSATNNSSFMSVVIQNLLKKNILIQFLGEAGFSGTSIVWTMYLVQNGYKTFGGMTYIGAVANIIPSSLDVCNFLSYFESYTQLEGLLTEYYSFDFGVGFSLVAESYINFKRFGVIPIFFEAIIFGALLNLEQDDSMWKRYVSVAMLTVLLTIPRRDIVYLSNQLALCVIFPYIFIKIVQAFCRTKNVGMVDRES